MYIPQETAKRIKEVAKKRKVAISTVLKETGIAKGTITKMSNGSDIFVQTISKIADCLECSVDYLLGRNKYTSQQKEEMTDIQQLINAYIQLTDEGKRAVLNYTEYAATNPQYQKYTDVPKEA